MTDLEGEIVDVEIAGRTVAARVLATDLEAKYGRGTEVVHRVLVPNAGTFRVPENDILATTRSS